jgi:hypothetical protein
MEQELFGRADVDSTVTRHMSAVPMHPSRLSEPMRWLNDSADALRMECTGIGLNLVSGKYEFASLIVIDDEEFWWRFGGPRSSSATRTRSDRRSNGGWMTSRPPRWTRPRCCWATGPGCLGYGLDLRGQGHSHDGY